MEPLVQIDEADRAHGRPTFETANNSQFHEITVDCDDLGTIASACFATHLGAFVGTLP